MRPRALRNSLDAMSSEPMMSDPESGVKRCPRCGETKPLADFTGPRATQFRVYCNPCNADYVREWNAAHPERARQLRRDYIESGRYRETPSYAANLKRMRESRPPRPERYSKNHERALERIARELEHGRTCSVCGLTKPLDEFASCGKPRYPEYPDLHQKRPQCKECWSKLVWAKERERKGESSTPKT